MPHCWDWQEFFGGTLFGAVLMVTVGYVLTAFWEGRERR